jgi:hypothetical protein
MCLQIKILYFTQTKFWIFLWTIMALFPQVLIFDLSWIPFAALALLICILINSLNLSRFLCTFPTLLHFTLLSLVHIIRRKNLTNISICNLSHSKLLSLQVEFSFLNKYSMKEKSSTTCFSEVKAEVYIITFKLLHEYMLSCLARCFILKKSQNRHQHSQTQMLYLWRTMLW